MKTKSMRSRAAALFSALALAVMTLMVFPSADVSAAIDTTNAVDYSTGGMTINGSNLLVNGNTVTADTIINDGDQIKLDFSWSLPNFTDITYPFKIDLTSQLQGISLPSGFAEIDANGTEYGIIGNYLYVKVSPTLGGENRRGGCTLTGNAAVSGLDDDNNGSVTLKYFGATSTASINPPNAGLSITKALGSGYDPVYYNAATQKYYQDYTIKVSSPNAASSNVVLTDIPPEYTTGSFENVSVDGQPASFTADGKLNLGDIPQGGTKTITYSMEVTKAALTQSDYSKRVNTASVVSDTQTTPVSAQAHLNYSSPYAQKSGSYNAATGVITWTISYYPNTLKEEFTLTDTLDSRLDANASFALSAVL